MSDALTTVRQTILGLEAEATLTALGRWRHLRTAGGLDQAWTATVPTLAAELGALQVAAAPEAADASGLALAETGAYQAPSAWVRPAGFAGLGLNGLSLEQTLLGLLGVVAHFMAQGRSFEAARQAAGRSLTRDTATLIADAGRGAQAVDIAARTGVGYVRQAGPGACSRCLILAGRFYRWNAGFLRHPACNCQHRPCQERKSGDWVEDPYEHFYSMTEADQDRVFGKASAQAIRDGSDINRVVNARLGVSRNGLTTTVGTGKVKRGPYKSFAKPGRLTPEGIYLRARNRTEALELLRANGYLLDAGQVVGGSIVGQRQGWGQLGGGGKRVGARAEIERALATGVRNPTSRATMTAAERRLFDAQLRYETALEGRNPYGDGPATPEHKALAERDYRRWLETSGEIYRR